MGKDESRLDVEIAQRLVFLAVLGWTRMVFG
jgi:hypothetical protein